MSVSISISTVRPVYSRPYCLHFAARTGALRASLFLLSLQTLSLPSPQIKATLDAHLMLILLMARMPRGILHEQSVLQ